MYLESETKGSDRKENQTKRFFITKGSDKIAGALRFVWYMHVAILLDACTDFIICIYQKVLRNKVLLSVIILAKVHKSVGIGRLSGMTFCTKRSWIFVRTYTSVCH